MQLSGKVSWFGGPGDPTDSGHTANGETTKTPGIAVYNHSTLGGYWRVRAPNGRTVVLKQTDIGPAPWTGRKIDVTYSALGKFGFGEHNFPTDSEFKAEYLGRNPNLAASTAGPPASPSKPVALPRGESSGIDTAGFQKAQKAALIGKLIASTEGSKAAKENPLIASGLATTRVPQLSEFQVPGVTEAKASEPKTPVEPQGGVHLGKALPQGVARFDGKPVAGWIDQILKYARQHGWRGEVSSGLRTRAEQEAIYNSGVRPAARPGTSNHEGTEFPRGAVDVTDAAGLARILRGSPYAGTLVWAGAKDPVHFSHPVNGHY